MYSPDTGANESQTRKELIDPALEKAGWNIRDPHQFQFEIPVDGIDAEPWNGVTDYVLYRENGEVLAVVEAKRQSHNPKLALQQLEHYLTEISKREDQSFVPFGFLSNGKEHYFYERGNGAKRRIYGFFSRQDLERKLALSHNARPLSGAQINTSITNRYYQIEAIQRVAEAFDSGRRKTLLVMATGTGKTRVAMSIIDLFLKTNQARNVLFVADRDELVRQGLSDGFETHLEEPAARLTRKSLEGELTQRLYAVTLQTLSNHYKRLTPSFFDLIIFDEVHRSIFNKWNDVLEYFDARMIGLTATPAEFINRNTFIEFDCYDGTPTFLYTYQQAIDDGYLVPYQLYKAQTHYQSFGIKGVDLSEEERNALIEQGLDPDDLDFEGTELEKNVSNKDTLRRQWEEIMEVALRDSSGQMIGKTIIFAMTQAHALRLQEAFDELYPQFDQSARVITHQSEYRGQLIDKFKKEDEPRIAISVNMLETGVNVPEVVNLVFMTPVQSRIKLAQMIGRGTRNHETCDYPHRLPDGQKTEFLIIDFWDNDFDVNAEETISQSLPVTVRLFNTRLDLLSHLLDQQYGDDAQRVIADLRAQIAEIPLDALSVQRVLTDVPAANQAWEDAFWEHLTSAKINLLRSNVGPLLRYVPGIDVAETTFSHKVERLKRTIIEQGDTAPIIESIREDVSRLPEFVRENPQRNQAIRFTLSQDIEQASIQELTDLIDTLADQMRNKRANVNPFLQIDLQDFIQTRGFIDLESSDEPIYVTEYRERVENRISRLIERHPTIRAINADQAVSDTQLIQLERALKTELSDLELGETNMRRAYGSEVISLLSLLRRLLDLDPTQLPDYQTIVERNFDQFIEAHHPAFSADQTRFLRAVKSIFVRRGTISIDDLYDDAALRAFGNDAVERLFNDDQISELLQFADSLSA